MFLEQGPDLAAVQCSLTSFNTKENLLTRMFTLEYAIWFEMLLPGLRKLSLPTPLGGTSVFFRRQALERVGAWDAHNVTEDADLGLRLSRNQMRVEFCDSRTQEEAAVGLWQWLRQRSRWIKGFLKSWLVQMRAPLRCFRELGASGFLTVQALFLGGVVAALAGPFLLALWTLTLAGLAPDWLAQTPGWAVATLIATQIFGWTTLMIAAIPACRRIGAARLALFAPLLPLYWMLAGIAALMALTEVIFAPTKWRKTGHGRGDIAAALREEAITARNAPKQPIRAAE